MPPGGPTEIALGSSFGELLKRAREARGLGLDAVANATRIARHHLEALERSDLDALPAGPFGKGYVRSCATLLGIDPEPLLQDYRVRERQRGRGSAQDERRLIEELSHLVRRVERPTPLRARRPRLAVVALPILGILGLGILAAGGWLRSGSRSPRASIATPPLRSTPSPGVEEPVPARPSRNRGEVVETPPPPTDALRVADHGVGTGLAARWLVGRAERFPPLTPVTFWTLVLGGQPGHVIRHVWFQEGQAVMRVDLPIGGPHWRTSSRLLLPEGSAGRWAVEARTSDGRRLVRDEFLCEPPASPPRPSRIRASGAGNKDQARRTGAGGA
jgi:transcriptional regulator with XRE-family HTH domain